jgi:hypothetical protein
MKKCCAFIIAIFLLGSSPICIASAILLPMDEVQKNHLKSYGLAFKTLQRGGHVDWLLNYRGGSFLVPYEQYFHSECVIRGISFEILSDAAVNSLLKEIESPAVNMNLVRLEKAPRIAVYSPKGGAFLKDETDAVILVLDYAEIPYTILYDEEILAGQLSKFDWLHLHHEDFTGQAGRHLRPESQLEADLQKITAGKLGYAKVSAMKLDVARKIKGFCSGGGYLFAMCSGAETFEIALAANGVDISESSFDGDEPDPDAQAKLDFTQTLAFEDFTIEPGYSRKFSDINTGWDYWHGRKDFFSLFEFSAKWDIIPSLLTQNHEHKIREFIGQTTAFSKYVVKSSAVILAENRELNNVRYIYGELGKGHWTYYGGHDPEGNPGHWREPTDLNQHPNSPGFRLILNNVLFPSARKKKQKT